MKICKTCCVEKSLDQFYQRKYAKGLGSSTNCIECERLYRQTHYLQNKEKYVVKARQHDAARKKEITDYLIEYFNKHPCIDCGLIDPVVMEFDHVNGKDANVSELVHRKHSLSAIKKEIEKCVVRCCNCHRRKTAKDFGYSIYAALAQLEPEHSATNGKVGGSSPSSSTN